MYKIGLSTFGCVPSEENFKSYSKSGIDAIEICVNPYECRYMDYQKLKELSEKYKIALHSFHLPYYSSEEDEEIDIASVDENKRQYTVKYYSEFIAKASKIGISTIIVHPSTEPILDIERKAKMECAKKSLSELAEIADSYGAVLAVEDLPRTCLGKNSDEILELISVNEKLKVCFDTNHLLNESVIDFIHNVGNKIITLHVSDYDFIDEKHWLPGEGNVDWKALLSALKEAGYSGIWLYEVGFKSRYRELNCDDFIKNAKEIFEGKIL